MFESKRESIREIMEGVNYSKVKKIANNTVEYIDFQSNRNIRFHQTTIISFLKDGILLNSGGYHTVTTKDRINRFSGHRIHSDKGIWYVSSLDKQYVFADGMIIRDNGEVIGAGDTPKKAISFRNKVKKYAADYAENLVNGKIEKPSGGDCWLCLLKDTKTGKPAFSGDHIQSHIKERYFVPSLVLNAVEIFGSQADKNDTAMYLKSDGHEKGGFFFSGSSQHYFTERTTRILRKYLYRSLGI